LAKLETFLKKVQGLNEEKKYEEVIDLLTDAVLEEYQSADLYAEKALAYWRLKQYELCNEAAGQALSIDAKNAKALHYKGNYHENRKEYGKAIEAYNKTIEINPKYEPAYNGLGNIYGVQKEYDKAIEVYNKAIQINPKFEYAYNGLGNVYAEQKKYDKAIKAYNKAIQVNLNFEYAHYGLGNVYVEQQKYDKAIKAYNKAIQVNPNFEYAYHGLGYTHGEQSEYDKAIKEYNKAVQINQDYNDPHYNLGLAYSNLNLYSKSLKSFKQYIALSKSDDDYFTKKAKAKIEELEKLIKVPTLSEARALVNKIKSLLKFKKGSITHYTSLTVAKLLILDNSSFQLSEGTFVNDTSEGQEFFQFLALSSPSTRFDNILAQSFIPKPFIGSFVAENKHNDLTLWRMYGKEEKEEAKGCSITIDMTTLIKNLIGKTSEGTETSGSNQMNDEFSFYRVAYKKGSQASKFHIPGVGQVIEKELNDSMTQLSEVVSTYKEKNPSELPKLIEILNEIAFLFKSVEYQYEHEVRLVINGAGFDKKSGPSPASPRVYIDLVPIRSLIKKITLGPKVENAEEWAAAFYYQFQKDELSPEISISYLPYK